MLAWKGQVHGLYELFNCQGTDPLIPCQLVKWRSAIWTCVAVDFVCALLAEEVAVLALYDVPLFWNVETYKALEGFLHLPLVLFLCFLDGLLADLFANPLHLRIGFFANSFQLRLVQVSDSSKSRILVTGILIRF